MRLRNRFHACLVALLGVMLPVGIMAADLPASGSLATLDVWPAVGKEAVRISGTLPGAGRLQAVLYATFSQDVPTVLLSRHSVTTNAKGQFSATLPIAPGYVPGAIITVVVQSPSGVPLAQGRLKVAAPNVPGPADVLPPDYR
jgi:hypothetical protein